MRTLSMFFSATALVLSLVAGASAQDTPERVESFDDDIVDGTYQTPWAERIESRRLDDRHSLVRARFTYVPELLVSVEDL